MAIQEEGEKELCGWRIGYWIEAVRLSGRFPGVLAGVDEGREEL